jgi:hypothetical protein
MSTDENVIIRVKNFHESNLDLDFNPKNAIAFKFHDFIIILFSPQRFAR